MFGAGVGMTGGGGGEGENWTTDYDEAPLESLFIFSSHFLFLK